MRPFYRVWQFWQAITAEPLGSKIEAELKTVLSPPQMELFGRFTAPEQRHSYRVFSTLKEAGNNDPDLLAAALLHDVGKTVKPRFWWDKVVVVLGKAFMAERTMKWARREANGFYRPFVVKAHHAEWGACEAEAAQSSPLTVALIRHHHGQGDIDQELNDFLSLLQWADDIN